MHASKDIESLAGLAGDRLAPDARADRRWGRVILIFAALAGALMPMMLPVDITRHFEATAVLQVEAPGVGQPAVQALLLPLHRALAEPRMRDAIRNRLAEEAGTDAAATDAPALSLLQHILPAHRELAGAVSLAAGLPGQMLVQARGRDALEAARLANAAAAVLAARLVQRDADEAGPRVVAAQQALQRAQADLAAEAVTDADLAAWRAFAARGAEIDGQLRQHRGDLDQARRSLEAVNGLTAAGATEAALPAALDPDAIVPLRRQFLEARLQADRLAADLGPRHPKLIAARAAVEEARAAIARAIERERAHWQQEEARLADEIARLEAERRRLESRPVSPAEQDYVQKEAAVAAARKALAEAQAAAGRTPEAPHFLAELAVPARAADATATGLPFWLASLMGGLAAFCLAWAAFPVRAQSSPPVGGRADVQSGGQAAGQAIRPAGRRPVSDMRAPPPAAQPAAAIPLRPTQAGADPAGPAALPGAEALPPLRFAHPPAMAGNADRHLTPPQGALPSVAIPSLAPPTVPKSHRRETTGSRVSTDRGADGGNELADLLVSHRLRPDAHPLPSLLAAIMSGEAEVTHRHQPQASNDDLLQLRAELGRLRAEVAALQAVLDEGQAGRLRRRG